MSERRYKSSEGPLGKHRRDVETPMFVPPVDTQALLRFSEWRSTRYNKPIVDDLLAHYRFEPVTPETARRYVGEPRLRAVGSKAVKQLLENKEEKIAAGKRQVAHIAENTDQVLGIFWKVAAVRQAVLRDTLGRIKREEDIPADIRSYAADSIIDFGLCLESPCEPNWPKGRMAPRARSGRLIHGIKDQINQFAPGIGTQVATFGAFATQAPEALRSYDGVVLSELALEEQEFRLEAWSSRRVALAEAFPDATQDLSYLESMSLQEMLSIQDKLIP